MSITMVEPVMALRPLRPAGFAMPLAGPALAQREADLREEIREARGRVVEGQRVIMAKVNCRDERTFGARRRDDQAFFEFHICEDPNVRTC